MNISPQKLTFCNFTDTNMFIRLMRTFPGNEKFFRFKICHRRLNEKLISASISSTGEASSRCTNLSPFPRTFLPKNTLFLANNDLQVSNSTNKLILSLSYINKHYACLASTTPCSPARKSSAILCLQ